MKVADINAKIEEQFCKKTSDSLSDEALREVYIKSKSFQNKVEEMVKIMRQVEISEDQIKGFLLIYSEHLISPGVKGAIRGYHFNLAVKEHILSMDLDKEKFEVEFEKKNERVKTGEIPDWYIECKETGKTMIGMNQLDFWKGGQQVNRGSSYVVNNTKNTKHVKYLNIVCNYIQLRNKKGKLYTLFNSGFSNQTLCYIKGINENIKTFFSLT